METVAARADEPGPRVAEADDTDGPGETAEALRWDRFDWCIVAIVGAATFFVHPIHLILTRPYWLDEAWVADLTRVPWTRLPRLSSSTPVGFVALLRLVPGAGTQRARLVVLLLSAATVGMAYVFVRALAWPSRDRARVAATIAALVTMLAPLSLARNDLKQYTCDGFCALVVLTVAARVDRRDGELRNYRAPVWWLAAASVAVFPFSSTSAFVSVAAFAGVFGSALLRRERRRIIEVAAFGAAAGLALAIYFAVVVSPNTNSALSAYWDHYYLRGSPWHMLVVTWTRLGAIERWIGMPEAVFVLLVLAGIVTLARLHATAIAIAVPVLWIELVVVARQRRYPYLDLRTSHFLLVSSLVVLAIGVFGILQIVYRANRVVAVGAAIALAWMFALNFLPYVGKLEILSEDARARSRVRRGKHDLARRDTRERLRQFRVLVLLAPWCDHHDHRRHRARFSGPRARSGRAVPTVAYERGGTRRVADRARALARRRSREPALHRSVARRAGREDGLAARVRSRAHHAAPDRRRARAVAGDRTDLVPQTASAVGSCGGFRRWTARPERGPEKIGGETRPFALAGRKGGEQPGSKP